MGFKKTNDEIRLIADKDMQFTLPSGRVKIISKGDVGAICIGENKIGEDAWASYGVKLINTTIEGRSLIYGNTVLDDVKIKVSKKHRNRGYQNTIGGQECRITNTTINGVYIEIQNSKIEKSHLNSGNVICDAYIETTSIEPNCMISGKANVVKCNIEGQSAIIGKATVINSKISSDSEIAGEVYVRGCELIESCIYNNVHIDGGLNENKIKIRNSHFYDNASVIGKDIGIERCTVRRDFNIKSNVFAYNCCFNCNNRKHILAGEKDAIAKISNARIDDQYDYLFFSTPEERYIVYKGNDISVGLLSEEWCWKTARYFPGKYPTEKVHIQSICCNRKGTRDFQNWANWFSNIATIEQITDIVKKQNEILMGAFKNSAALNDEEYSDLLFWGMISISSYLLQYNNVATPKMLEKSSPEELKKIGALISKDISLDIGTKTVSVTPRPFITEDVFNKILNETRLDREYVHKKLKNAKCVFIGFHPENQYVDNK